MSNGTVGAPKGNTNNSKGRPWTEILNRALIQDNGVRLRQAAELLLTKASEGDLAALSLIADRMDGKPAQSLLLQGDADNPLALTVSHGMELDSVQLLDKVRGIER